MRKPLPLATAMAFRACIAAGLIWLTIEYVGTGLAFRDLSHAAMPPMATLLGAINWTAPHVVLSGVGTLAMLLAICLILRRKLRLRLRDLTEGMQRMAAGDNDYRLAAHGGDELAAFAHAANRLADGFAQQGKALQAAFEARVLEMASDCEDATTASTHKREQLMALSHELRTPLNGIFGALELMAHEADRAAQQALMASASQSAHHLLGLADRLLDWSYLESGCMKLHPAPASLLRLIDEAILAIIPAAQRKGLALSVLVKTNPRLEVTVDALRLRQIVLNLLGNAVKFTAHGSVSLEVGHSGGMLVLTVADSGPGIPDGMHERIFEPFIRADHNSPGTGLGLAIASQLVAMMGGVITADNGESGGACFRVEIPLAAAIKVGPVPSHQISAPARLHRQLLAWGLHVSKSPHQAADEALEDPGLTVLPGRLWQTLLAARPEVRSGDTAATPSRHGMPPDCSWTLEILLVDDMAPNRMIVSNMLTMLGHRVSTAGSASQALRQGRAKVFDLLIFDLGMAQMSGAQAVRAWRRPNSRVLDPDCRIVALTGSTSDEDRAEAIAAGMHDYLIKPATMAQLAAVIDDACAHQVSRGVELTPRAVLQRPLLDMARPEIAQRLALDLETSARALRNAIRRRDLDAARRLLHALSGCAGQAGLIDVDREIMHLGRLLGTLRDSDWACCAYRLDRLDSCIRHASNGAAASARSFQQAEPPRPVHEFGDVMRIELAHQMQPMRLHRF